MSKQAINWVTWASVATIVCALGVAYAVLGRTVDIARGPERMDKQDERMDRMDGHMTFTDGRVTALEQFNATNNLNLVYTLKDMQREIHAIHAAVTN